ncbi:DEAD/DEAH box helicase [Bacteroidales bacterium OttesenSCG-928-B11]|nr:DEAD/DEAH box helicase [Bacteroidales bacterium OttesenSCG-928-C03]MDL2312148.1 DEAD/DEAH box helicase [Bacteroidales bacterium OttesenSCG-928-B11]
MTFQELNIIEPILKALDEKKYIKPTPIQEKAIPPAMECRDILGCAQTGTGKTAAFAIPIIQQLYKQQHQGKQRPIRALVLTPTRELAIQIEECFRHYAKYTNVKHGLVFGGVNQNPQIEKLKKGVDVLIATPGRLLDLISQGFVKLDAVEHFVLDEADRMLDMGFIHDIKRVLMKLPKKKQTLFFSATMPPPIAALSKSILYKPIRIDITPESSVVETIEQFVYYVEKEDKRKLLVSLVKEAQKDSVLVFSRTKHGADRIARILCRAGIGSEAIHGNKSQTARQNALTNFKSGKTRVMIATDIAARGLDIQDLPLVINYDLPDVPETYVHRIGRTGRAGKTGKALTLCSQDEMSMLLDIQKKVGITIPALC